MAIQRFFFYFTKSEFIVMRISLGKGDIQKISNLVHQKGAKQAIIADIYGCRYGEVQEYGLADSTNPYDFHAKLESLQEEWIDYVLVSSNGFARKKAHFCAERDWNRK